MIEYMGTIVNQPTGKNTVTLSTGSRVYLVNVIGPLQTQDIGKRVYQKNGVLMVENNSQRDARIK